MARVLLVNPPATQTLVGNNPPFLDEERGCNPPLGLLYLAAVLQARSDHAVGVVDAMAEGLSYPQLGSRIAEAEPDLVGISAMTFTLLDVVRAVATARQAAPRARVAVGGPHVHLYPRETAALSGVDFALRGEGDLTFLELCDRLDCPSAWEEVPGLVFRRDGQLVETPPAPPIDDLDALPFPARHLVPIERYSSVLAHRRPVTTMFTSRGCPYRCTFCDRPHLGKKFRAQSAARVVDEMAACAAMGIPEILVYDDTFTVRRQRVLDICSGIQRRALDVGWDIRARVDTVDPEMLAALRAAGCERIHYGVEAGSDRLMQVLRKGITVEQARQAFRDTRRAGIATLAYFMIGIPGETEADVRQTFELARQLRPDVVHITILTPFPGTAIYHQALEEGVYERDYWRDFALQPRPGFRPRYWTRELSRERLEELLVEGYKDFYARPAYVARQLLKVRSWGELRDKVRAGLRVAFLRKR
ncbi:MAG: B12-binding domain-containing radical SAM protein [Candidatus Brocadiia bacterium]